MNIQNNNHPEDDVKVLLKKIVAMQSAAVRSELQEEMCDADSLGIIGNTYLCNTRPLQLFTAEDHSWHCPVGHDSDSCGNCEESCIFRVEKVENDVAVFRMLIACSKDCDEAEQHDTCHDRIPHIRHYRSTDSFITIKLDRISAVRCLRDCFVDLCIR